MALESLAPPGLVVNHLKGDPAERRVHEWLVGYASQDLDVDAIDQSRAPGTAAPKPAGLDARDAQYALRRLGAHSKTIAMDVV